MLFGETPFWKAQRRWLRSTAVPLRSITFDAAEAKSHLVFYPVSAMILMAGFHQSFPGAHKCANLPVSLDVQQGQWAVAFQDLSPAGSHTPPVDASKTRLERILPVGCDMMNCRCSAQLMAILT